MESWASLGGKEGYTNIQILAESGIKRGVLKSEERDFTNYTNQLQPPMWLWFPFLMI